MGNARALGAPWRDVAGRDVVGFGRVGVGGDLAVALVGKLKPFGELLLNQVLLIALEVNKVDPDAVDVGHLGAGRGLVDLCGELVGFGRGEGGAANEHERGRSHGEDG